MKNERPLILITNDDGVSAPGIRALIAVMADNRRCCCCRSRQTTKRNGTRHYH